MRWTPTTVAGETRYCAQLADARWAYVEPSRRVSGRWCLRIVKRPGQQLADLYLTRDSADECMAAAEHYGRAVA